MNENLRKLYDNLVKDGYDLPDFDTFSSDMGDTTKAQRLYTTMTTDGYEVPDQFDSFYKDITPKQESQTVKTGWGQAYDPKEVLSDIGEYTTAGIGAFNRGISQVVSSPLKMLGAVLPDSPIIPGVPATSPRTIYKAGDTVENFTEDVNPRDENVNQTFQSVGEGLGQGVGMIATAGTSAPSALAQTATKVPSLFQAAGQIAKQVAAQSASVPGVIGGSMTAVPEWEAAKQAGLSDEDAFQTLVKNYLVGQTEALPIQNLLGRLNKVTGNKILNTVKSMGTGGIEEGTQEAVQQYLTNQIAKDDYDPDRDPLFQVLESAKVGGIVGFLLPGMVSTARSLPAEKRVKLERKIGELNVYEIVNQISDTGDEGINAEIDNAATVPQAIKETIEQPVIEEAVEQEQKEEEQSLKKEEAETKKSVTLDIVNKSADSVKESEQPKETKEKEIDVSFEETPEYIEADKQVREIADQIRQDPNNDQLFSKLNEAKQGRDNARIAYEKVKKERVEKSIKMTPAEALKHQVQTFYRGVDKGVRKGKDLTNDLVSKVQEAVKEFPLNSQQTSQLLTKVRKTNLYTPGSISKLNSFIDRITTDARYAENLSVSEQLRDRIKQKSKTKVESIPRNYKAIAKDFSRIKPDNVENFEEYQSIADQVIGGFADPKTIGYNPINVSKVQSYINRINNESKGKEIQQVREEFDFGDEFSDDEIQSLIDSENLDEEEFYVNKEDTKKKIARDKILKTAEFAKIGLEDVKSEDNQQIIDNLNNAPLDELSDGQLVEFVRTADNIVENDDFTNTARIEAQIEAVNNANKLLKEVKGDKGELGVIKGSFYNVPMMFNAIYSDSEKAAKVQLRSGLQDVYNGGSKVESQEHELYEDFQKEAKRIKQKYGKTPLEGLSQIRRGVFGTLVRYPKGEDPNSVLVQSKNIVQESIKRLKRKKERKDLANDAEKAYQPFKDANTIEEVFTIMKKVDPAGLEMWQFFNKEFDTKVKGKLKKNAEQIFNEEFVEENNYTPKVFEVVDTAESGELDAQRAFTSDLPSKPKQSKTAIKATNALPSGRALNFEFDNNMFRKFRESMYDVETSKPRLLFREFMRLPKASEILGGNENKQRLSETYRKSEEVQRGIGRDYSDASKLLDEVTGALRTLGYTAALGSVDQFVKQYIPVATNTIWNLGGDSGLFFSHIPKEADNLFNQYTIGQRGRRLGGAERGESIKYKIQSAYRNKLLKAVNRFHTLTEKGSSIFMHSLTQGDVSVAKRSWAAYYLKYLKDKGVDLKTVDLATEHQNQIDPLRREAAAFAEQKVKETQVVSNPSELAKLLRTAPGAENWIKNIFIPFSTFSVNTKVRLIENIRQLRTNENKAEAYRALAGTMTEVALYSTIKFYLLSQVYDFLKSGIENLFDLDGDEPDKEFRFKQWYSAIVKDIIPFAIGTMGESIAMEAVNRIAWLFDNPDASYQDWQKENKGGTFYRYKGDSNTMDLGLYSIGLDKVQETVKDTQTSFTGDATVSNYFGEKDINLDDDQKKFVGFMTALEWLSNTGYMDAGFFNTLKKIQREQYKKGDSQSNSESHKPKARPKPHLRPASLLQ